MRKTALILLAAFTLCACQPKSVTDGKRAWTKYFNKVLKDPESFKVYEEKYEVVGEHNVRWTLDYGAKNSYGAMVRNKVTFYTTGRLIDIDGKLIDTEKDL